MSDLPRKLGTVFALVALVWAGWKWLGPEPDDRAFLLELPSRVAESVEKKDAGFVKKLISPSYSDSKGRSRDDIHQAVLAQTLVQGQLSVFILGPLVEIDQEKQPPSATLTFSAALTRGPKEPGILDLLMQQGSVYRFTLTLEKGPDGWLVTSGEWQRAGS